MVSTAEQWEKNGGAFSPLPPLEIHEKSLGDEIPDLNPLKHITGGHKIENGQASGILPKSQEIFSGC